MSDGVQMNGGFLSLQLDEWQETRDALQSYARVVGKIRQALTPPQKHWWHVSLRLDGGYFTLCRFDPDRQPGRRFAQFPAHCSQSRFPVYALTKPHP
jgi:hypothetical protein